VKPLVVFLNDWQINRPATERDVAVVNEGELEQYLNRQEPILSPAEVADVSTWFNNHAFAAAG
jgi:hypothetical protein